MADEATFTVRIELEPGAEQPDQAKENEPPQEAAPAPAAPAPQRPTNAQLLGEKPYPAPPAVKAAESKPPSGQPVAPVKEKPVQQTAQAPLGEKAKAHEEREPIDMPPVVRAEVSKQTGLPKLAVKANEAGERAAPDVRPAADAIAAERPDAVRLNNQTPETTEEQEDPTDAESVRQDDRMVASRMPEIAAQAPIVPQPASAIAARSEAKPSPAPQEQLAGFDAADQREPETDADRPKVPAETSPRGPELERPAPAVVPAAPPDRPVNVPEAPDETGTVPGIPPVRAEIAPPPIQSDDSAKVLIDDGLDPADVAEMSPKDIDQNLRSRGIGKYKAEAEEAAREQQEIAEPSPTAPISPDDLLSLPPDGNFGQVQKSVEKRMSSANNLERKLYHAGSMDTSVLDDTYQKAELANNEALRTLHVRYDKWKKFIASGNDPAKNPEVRANIEKSLESTHGIIKQAAHGLRKIGMAEEADWYDRHGRELVEEARTDLLGAPSKALPRPIQPPPERSIREQVIARTGIKPEPRLPPPPDDEREEQQRTDAKIAGRESRGLPASPDVLRPYKPHQTPATAGMGQSQPPPVKAQPAPAIAETARKDWPRAGLFAGQGDPAAPQPAPTLKEAVDDFLQQGATPAEGEHRGIAPPSILGEPQQPMPLGDRLIVEPPTAEPSPIEGPEERPAAAQMPQPPQAAPVAPTTGQAQQPATAAPRSAQPPPATYRQRFDRLASDAQVVVHKVHAAGGSVEEAIGLAESATAERLAEMVREHGQIAGDAANVAEDMRRKAEEATRQRGEAIEQVAPETRLPPKPATTEQRRPEPAFVCERCAWSGPERELRNGECPICGADEEGGLERSVVGAEPRPIEAPAAETTLPALEPKAPAEAEEKAADYAGPDTDTEFGKADRLAREKREAARKPVEPQKPDDSRARARAILSVLDMLGDEAKGQEVSPDELAALQKEKGKKWVKENLDSGMIVPAPAVPGPDDADGRKPPTPPVQPPGPGGIAPPGGGNVPPGGPLFPIPLPVQIVAPLPLQVAVVNMPGMAAPSAPAPGAERRTEKSGQEGQPSLWGEEEEGERKPAEATEPSEKEQRLSPEERGKKKADDAERERAARRAVDWRSDKYHKEQEAEHAREIGGVAPKQIEAPFDPVAAAMLAKEADERRRATDVARRTPGPAYDAVYDAKRKEEEAADAKRRAPKPPPASFDPIAEAAKATERDRNARAVDAARRKADPDYDAKRTDEEAAEKNRERRTAAQRYAAPVIATGAAMQRTGQVAQAAQMPAVASAANFAGAAVGGIGAAVAGGPMAIPGAIASVTVAGIQMAQQMINTVGRAVQTGINQTGNAISLDAQQFTRGITSLTHEIPIFGGAIGAVTHSFLDLHQTVGDTVERFAKYNGALAAASAREQVRVLERDIRRSQEFGPELGKLQEGWVRINEKFDKLMDDMFPAFANFATKILKYMEDNVGLVRHMAMLLAQIASNIAGALASFRFFGKENQKKFMQLAVATGQLVQELARIADNTRRPDEAIAALSQNIFDMRSSFREPPTAPAGFGPGFFGPP